MKDYHLREYKQHHEKYVARNEYQGASREITDGN